MLSVWWMIQSDLHSDMQEAPGSEAWLPREQCKQALIETS